MSEIDSTKIILNNECLEVEISNPGAFYKGSRFDWNGFIMQVTLDGTHTFCVPESLEPGKGTGGEGLCGEFGIEEPIGYDETPVDHYFHKIGVGLLKKTDMLPYDFFRSYEVIHQSSNIIANKETVSFSTSTSNQNGYTYEYKKSISIQGNNLKISYFLYNSGTKRISTTEYCHNFIGIDNQKVDSSYSLKLPCELLMQNVVGEIEAEDKVITWPDTVMDKQFYCQIQGYDSNEKPSWEIYNSKTGVGVREIDNFPVCKFALWGYRHVISPETFIKIELEPGQTKTWTRQYEFFIK